MDKPAEKRDVQAEIDEIRANVVEKQPGKKRFVKDAYIERLINSPYISEEKKHFLGMMHYGVGAYTWRTYTIR